MKGKGRKGKERMRRQRKGREPLGEGEGWAGADAVGEAEQWAKQIGTQILEQSKSGPGLGDMGVTGYRAGSGCYSPSLG